MHILRWLSVVAVLGCLSAENSGFYAQVGFQYSHGIQANGTSKQGIQEVQTFTPKTIKISDVFPWGGAGGHIPQASTIQFPDSKNNPYTNVSNALNNIASWNGQADMNIQVDKTNYSDNRPSLINAWVSSTLEYFDQANRDNPALAIGALLHALSTLSSDIAVQNLGQSPQVKIDVDQFSVLEKEAKSVLGDTFITGNVTFEQLQAQMRSLENAASTLSNQLFSALTSVNQDKLVVPDNRKNITDALLNSIGGTQAGAQAAQIALQKYYQNNRSEFFNVHTSTTKKFLSAMQYRHANVNFYGVDMQVGYKQFFGKKRRWGVRYYGSFSYNGGRVGKGAYSVNNFAYGVGVDALYNFSENTDSTRTHGIFFGLMLIGTSWSTNSSTLKTMITNCKNDSACQVHMGTSYFQLPLNFGFRSNIDRHNGFEVGMRIPLLPILNYYATTATNYGQAGVYKEQIGFRRDVSFYCNYVYNFNF
ncbi:outer membrane protein [Helicobacter baculiformis]|uniref:Outer membrane protein n=1 Tax=Helicobacter baculiformis TaxID=427351 RepID=A0ABV7ZJ13_9HELI|nr:outer membrane protein [Helicobacter baculiformis]